ncbi:MAG: glycogen phosphorylase [Candidatus Methylomirabilota bacterium]|nr:glycogen/starch/alpha-glucan phosphorylase [Candidatus Methylomirabilis sp.]NJD68998.1 glycogen/starch/alpha-glucan phosphorylase [candidate division NC10 bacterium]PWB45946.1 MAG: glycogen phosphorylase [candidate division NC10 bacterium]
MSTGRLEQDPRPESGTYRHVALTVSAFQDAIRHHARYSLGKKWERCSSRELFMAVAFAVRDVLIDRMLATEDRYQQADPKRLHYLSMEFLLGQSLRNNLSNLGMLDPCREALRTMGVDLDEVLEGEAEAALGNGGLGRLAACFLDSLATMGIPGYGYGINYEYGLFKQAIDGGYQKEKPDNWMAHGNPWQIERPDEACIVPVYGRVEHGIDRTGGYNPMWMDWKIIIGVPHDMPIVGYGGHTVNVLRLYSARSSEEFDMQIFNEGDYLKAVEQQIASETISKVLYPADSIEAGRELRLLQEYLLVACTLRDIMRRYSKSHTSFDQFPSKVAIQLNDTHPALAVAELMRMLVDEHAQPWEAAWEITQATLSYTNHTLMPEALERWSVSLLESVLPRHLQIMYEINRRFLAQVASMWPRDHERLRRMSLIEEGEPKQVRMVNLALVGSHAVNGVSTLHTQLVTTYLAPDFAQLWPDKFSTKTNGVTPRRWLLQANPLLADLITNTIGSNGWIGDLGKLRALESHIQDRDFRHAFMAIKRVNKVRLARLIYDVSRVVVSPDALFDVHVKRIHEYKRQLLNVMQIVHQYLRIVEDGLEPSSPRVYIFAGKAAPGYWTAKQIIKLITSVGQVINNDPRVKGLIKVVFLPDYRVSLAEQIVPAADVNQQISMAGTEASGTGSMKFAMNGAPIVGTYDGANVEIMQEVGEENIFLFGLQVDAARQMRERGSHHPRDHYHRNPHIRRLMDVLGSTLFCPNQPGLFRWVGESVLDRGDPYFHLADLESYIDTQNRVAQAFEDPAGWASKAILNVARIGKFSSDRAITEYAREIWNIQPVL